MLVSMCVIGDSSAEGNRRIGELARKVMIHLTAFNVEDYFPSLSWLGVLSGLNSKLKSLSKEFDEFFDEVIQERRMRLANKDDHFSNATKSLLDVILQLQHDGNLDSDFSQVDIKSILMDMFVAGTDTGSTTMEWVMTELVRNPTKMKKAQEEIRRIVGDKSKVDENDIDKMRYLKCVVKETLRLHPPAVLGNPRVARSSVEVDRYTIPAKTLVYVNIWAIQRDSEVWENAEEFLPERFEKNEVDFKGQDMRFIPFGSGRRICPGTSFGIASVELMLANILFWFDWKLPSNGNGVSVQDIDMAETFGLTVFKKQPLCLQAIPYSVQQS